MMAVITLMKNKVLDDLIMNGYEDMPIEYKKRSPLHQKCLEQLDANERDNVLQRLNCNQIHRELPIIDDVVGAINYIS